MRSIYDLKLIITCTTCVFSVPTDHNKTWLSCLSVLARHSFDLGEHCDILDRAPSSFKGRVSP